MSASVIIQNETNEETNSQLPFVEIPEFYSDVYNLIFKKDKKMGITTDNDC